MLKRISWDETVKYRISFGGKWSLWVALFVLLIIWKNNSGSPTSAGQISDTAPMSNHDSIQCFTCGCWCKESTSHEMFEYVMMSQRSWSLGYKISLLTFKHTKLPERFDLKKKKSYRFAYQSSQGIIIYKNVIFPGLRLLIENFSLK